MEEKEPDNNPDLSPEIIREKSILGNIPDEIIETRPINVPSKEQTEKYYTYKNASTKFRNPILKYPSEIQGDINRLILRGAKAPTIKQHIETQWKDKLDKIPTINTIQKYILLFHEDKKPEEKQELVKIENEIKDLDNYATEIEKTLSRVTDPKIPISDKKFILDLLLKKCIQRVQSLEKFQKMSFSSNFESVIIRYFTEIRTLIETMAKLSNELSSENNVIVNIIDDRIQPVFQAFYNIILEIAPDRIEYVKIRLREELNRAIQ